MNIVKVISGFYLSRLLKQPIVFGLPLSVSIEPTTSCNLRCPECPSGLRSFSRPTGMLDKKLFEDVADQLSRDLLYMIFYFQGEPFLNPEFLEMVNYASRRKIYTATSTNAHFITSDIARKTVESGLDRLIISIDGTTQEVYEQYRVGGTLKKVLDGAGNIVEWKKKLKSQTPFVILQFLVVRPNEHQITEAKRLAKKLGADKIVFKTAQLYDYENGNKLMPLQEKYSRYKKRSTGKFEIKNKLLNHCWKLWHTSVITWDGRTVPCCFDKDARFNMGQLTTHKFNSVWKGKEYSSFRKSILKSRKEIDICTNCSEGTKIFN